MGRSYNKINDLELKSIFNYHDIVMLTESWLNDSSECSVDDFTYYRLNRTLNHKIHAEIVVELLYMCQIKFLKM